MTRLLFSQNQPLENEQTLVKDENTIEIQLPLSSTVVLNRSKEMPYTPLDFDNHPFICASIDPAAYDSAITETELDKNKQQALIKFLIINQSPKLQTKKANRQLEKRTTITGLKYASGGHILLDHFVVMKNVKVPNIGLQYFKHKSVIIYITQDSYFPIWQCWSKRKRAIDLKTKICPLWIQRNKSSSDHQTAQNLHWTSSAVEHNGYKNCIGQKHRHR